MIDDNDDVDYPPNSFGAINNEQFSVENVSSSRNVGNQLVDDHDNDNEEKDIINSEDDDVDNNGENGVKRIGICNHDAGEDESDDDHYHGRQRQPLKRKFKTLLSSYKFAPRVPGKQSSAVPEVSNGEGNPLSDWTEQETLILLDSWGDIFLKQGWKSLRSEEWQEVANKVSHESENGRTDTQCRNRLDTLKKKYKKEKTKLVKMKDSTSEWVYFKKMDMLLSAVPQSYGLSCGVDSGEYIFMNPKVYLNHSSGYDEMRDSPGNSESSEDEEDELEDILSPKKMPNGKVGGSEVSLKLLADSIWKFGEIYEKTETSKSQGLLELEKMRMDFHRDLELQKRQILDRGQAEISRLRHGDAEDNEVSIENLSD